MSAITEAVAKREVEVAAGLDELAEIINREHELVVAAGKEIIRHAILCGEALLAAKAQIQPGNWNKWVNENQGRTVRDATTIRVYMRIAEFKNEIIESGVRDISAAKALLMALGFRRSSTPISKYSESTKNEVRALWATREWVSESALARAVGVPGGTVNAWLNPGRTKIRNKANHAAMLRRRAAAKRSERDEAARRAGGGISEAYSQTRRLAQTLDRLGRDGSSVEIRTAASLALGRCHLVEDAIVRALGLS